MAHEALGVCSAIHHYALEAAHLGFLTVIPHLYHRLDSPFFESVENFELIEPYRNNYTAETTHEDIHAALSFLSHNTVSQRAVVGFCMGRSLALRCTAHFPIVAAITYYGGGLVEERWLGLESVDASASHLRAPWMGIYASLDPGNPPEVLDALDDARRQCPSPSSVVVFRGVDHAFSLGEGVFPSYSPHDATFAPQLGWNFLHHTLH